MDFNIPPEQLLPSASEFPIALPSVGVAFRHRSIATPFCYEGRGVHTGKPVAMQILPAPAGHGVVFERGDIASQLGPSASVLARYDYVDKTYLRTRIANKFGVEVSTVEHICAALAGFGINNAVIALSDCEVPSGDGSCLNFAEHIRASGVKDLGKPRTAIRIVEAVEFSYNGGFCRFDVCDERIFSFVLDYDGCDIGQQEYEFNFGCDNFMTDVAPARTFGFAKDLQALQARGLALGANPQNTVVLDDRGYVAPGVLRFPDEFARHKVLDAIGDVALAGVPIIGRFHGFKSGHHHNNELLRKLFSDERYFTAIC